MADKTRVLVADDDTEMRVLLRHFIEKSLPGSEVVTGTSGRRAVELFRAARAAGRPFDFVLLDVMMPDMDGPQAAEAIRRIDPGVPCAFLTAYPQHADETLRADDVPVWVKPDDVLEVAGRIEQMLADRRGGN